MKSEFVCVVVNVARASDRVGGAASDVDHGVWGGPDPPPSENMQEGSEYVLISASRNIIGPYSFIQKCCWILCKLHIVKDEKLVSKMEGKTIFFEAPETV